MAKEIVGKNNKSLKWSSLKRFLFDKFKSKLCLKEKIDLRKNLMQRKNENCLEFRKRCVKYQFLLCDDQEDSIFERDILINFVCGLKDDIYYKVILNENISKLDICVKIATDIENSVIENNNPVNIFADSSENIGNEIKVEECFDNENVKNELFEDYNDFKISDDNNYINSRENLKLRRKKSFHNEIDTNLKSEDDYSSSCSDTDSDFQLSFDELKVLKKLDSSAIKTAKKVKINKENPQHSCTLCDKKYYIKSRLQKHLFVEHDVENEKIVKCPYCGNIFACKSQSQAKTTVMKHISNHHPGMDRFIPEIQPKAQYRKISF